MTTETALNPSQLVEDYATYKIGQSTSFSGPSQSNRCSVLGHPCTAYCYYDRTVAPQERIQISSDLASIFAEGRDQERTFQRDLLEMGYEVVAQQGSLAWPKYNITGHRDFKISRGGATYVRCEFKSCHPFLFDKLNTYADVKNHKSYFIRKWAAQTVLYMLLDGQQVYWLILKNKSTGRIKPIVFEWNDELWHDAEALLKKAELIEVMVKLQSVSDHEKLADIDVCAGCEFLTVCNPPLNFGAGVDVIEPELAAELAELAERRESVKEAASQYDDLDEELKSTVKKLAGTEKRTLAFGDWAASVKRIVDEKGQLKQTRISFLKLKKAELAK